MPENYFQSSPTIVTKLAYIGHTDMRFDSGRHAIRFFLSHNPARFKRPNILELSGGKTTILHFTGDHPDDIWAQILLAARSAMQCEHFEARLAFNLCEIGRPLGQRIHPTDAAKVLHTHARTVYRYINRIYDEFERELKVRSLLKIEEPENDSGN